MQFMHRKPWSSFIFLYEKSKGGASNDTASLRIIFLLWVLVKILLFVVVVVVIFVFIETEMINILKKLSNQ